ncbi:MAG: hypothetical protein ACJ8C4_11230 [Gemmataceae bacterium]
MENRLRPTLRERLLGAFVTFQLIAIPLGSYIKLVPARYPEHHGELNGDLQTQLPKGAEVNEPLQKIKDATAYVMSRWGEVSGQAQCWALFATFGVQAAMPAVELQWADRDPVTLRCYFEPANPSRYFYYPEPCCRLFNYEYRTVIYYWASKPQDYTKPEQYRKDSMQTAFEQRRSTMAYLRWKTAHYLEENPDLPVPTSVILKARISPDPSPGAWSLARPAGYEVPVARWQPADQAFAVWDPIAKLFVSEEAP